MSDFLCNYKDRIENLKKKVMWDAQTHKQQANLKRFLTEKWAGYIDRQTTETVN